jgi:hypothetical protein
MLSLAALKKGKNARRGLNDPLSAARLNMGLLILFFKKEHSS